MYLAMNRFTVPLENAADFEELWLSRKSRLASARASSRSTC